MNVIITGASRGIGRGIATALARRGHTIGAIARSHADLAELASQILSAGGICHTAVADVSSQAECEIAVAALTAQLGHVDALVNNAGMIIRQDVMTIAPDDWRAMMATNINGVFYMCRATIPAMIARGSGHIVNISSISGRLPLAGGSGYAASKYAVTGFSESLFLELREHGIKVTVVFPGSVDTASHRHDPAVDASWKVAPEDVGEAIHSLLATPANTCVSRLEIRPLQAPKR